MRHPDVGHRHILRLRPILLAAVLAACLPHPPAAAQAAQDRHGWAGDVAGVHAVAAAPFRSLDAKRNVGAVTFYALDGSWKAVAEVPSPSPAAGALFGYAVALDGDVAVVGAPGDHEGGLLAGAAYVYAHRGGAWTPVQKLLPNPARAAVRMGSTVDAGHGLVAVASRAGCGASGKGGCVYLFERQQDGWGPSARLERPDDDPDAAFGTSVEIVDARTVVVGAPTGAGAAERAGEVYVFRRDGGAWAAVQHLVLPDGQMGDLFGESLVAADGALFVGSPGRAHAAHGGAVYAYRWTGDAFTAGTVLDPGIDEDYLLFGQSLAAANGRLLVGAPRKNEADTRDAGAIYVYAVSEGSPSFLTLIADPDPATDAGFGYLVRTDGTHLMAGAPFGNRDGAAGTGNAYFQDLNVLTDVDAGLVVPDRYALHDNFPNPFNPSTTVRYALPEAAHVRITVYDVLGRMIALLVDARQAPGTHDVTFDARDFASGVYFYEMEAGPYQATRRMVLLK